MQMGEPYLESRPEPMSFDIESVRSDFPLIVDSNLVYLDNAATLSPSCRWRRRMRSAIAGGRWRRWPCISATAASRAGRRSAYHPLRQR